MADYVYNMEINGILVQKGVHSTRRGASVTEEMARNVAAKFFARLDLCDITILGRNTEFGEPRLVSGAEIDARAAVLASMLSLA